MNYNENNIDGIQFQYRGSGIVYRIDKKNKCVVDDSGGTHVDFEIITMIKALNSGDWIPINQGLNYEIY